MVRYLLIILGLSLALASAADWPRFRGPNGSGVADTVGLPSQLDLLWKVALPAGHSSPVLSARRIFLTGEANGKLYTLCLDRTSGKVLWRREAPRTRSEKLDKRNHAASPSAVIDGQNVYVFFGDYGLAAYGPDGGELWRTPLGPFRNVYGMGASPVIVDDTLVLVCDQGVGSFIAGFDKGSGRMRWKTARPEAVSGHSTPAIYEQPGQPAQILAPSSFQLTSYSAATGEKLWWIHGLASEMKSAPVIDGDTVFVSGYNTPENDPGKQVRIAPFADVLAGSDANKDGKISLAESPDEKTKKYFIFLDLDRDGMLDEHEWDTYRATMAAENGLLALRLPVGAAGRGDLTAASLRWKYGRSVPQLPSVLVYRGVLYMINDGGVLSTFTAATGALIHQSRLRGAIDHYYASPVAADGKVFIASQSGIVTVLKAGGEYEILSSVQLDDECYATPA